MIVITFHTTADAFAFEAACKKAGVPGHLGTTPRTISATCGFAWLCDAWDEDEMRAFASENALDFEGLFSS